MSAFPTASPLFHVDDPDTGLPLALGKVYTYASGTTTPKTTWADKDKVGANANPVPLNGNGDAPIFLDGGYKFIVKRADDTTVYELDGVTSLILQDASGIGFENSGTDLAATNVQDALEELDAEKLSASQAGALFLTPAEAAAAYQPLDGDLTAIAALATTAYGRSLLTLASRASARDYIGALKTFNVMDYGAVGDGVADDATAIQAAITACYATAHGGQVYLPAGNYLFGTQISIPKTAGKSCRFFGDGTNATLLTIAAGLTTSTGAIAVGSASSAGGCDIAIESLSVTGANTKKAFQLTNANICRFYRVECRSVAIGVQFETSYFVQFRECEFDSCATYGMVTTTTAHGLRVENSGFYAITGQGIYLAGAGASDNIIITGNDFETTTTPIQFDPGVYSLIFTGNYVEYAAGALWSFGATSNGVIIEGNWLAFSASTSCNNIATGRLAYNDLYDQTITRGTAGGSFVANDNQIRGTSTVTGFGGAVTQATSKSTGVTLNKRTGQITTNSASLAAGAEVTFTVTNSDVAATDVIHVIRASGGTANSYSVQATAVASGSFDVTISNLTAGALAEALVLNFAVIKAVAA